VTKFREKMLGGEIGIKLKEIIGKICEDYEWKVEALEVMEDHIHLFVSCPPKYAPAQVMNIIKSLTAKELFEKFPGLRKVQWSGRIWADEYYGGSSGERVTKELIQKYIKYQKDEMLGTKQMNLFDNAGNRPKKRKTR
jgi:putative transposase